MLRKQEISEEYAEKYFISLGNLFENPELILIFEDNALAMATAVSRNVKELNNFIEIINKWK